MQLLLCFRNWLYQVKYYFVFILYIILDYISLFAKQLLVGLPKQRAASGGTTGWAASARGKDSLLGDSSAVTLNSRGWSVQWFIYWNNIETNNYYNIDWYWLDVHCNIIYSHWLALSQMYTNVVLLARKAAWRSKCQGQRAHRHVADEAERPIDWTWKVQEESTDKDW